MERLVLSGAILVDGSGERARQADVYVEDGRIARVGAPTESHNGWRLEVLDGLHLCPGFVDVHSHADRSPFLAWADTTKILQGVTTEVVGNCGASLLGVGAGGAAAGASDELDALGCLSPAAFMAALDEARPVTNQAYLLGHGTLRRAVVGMADRAPTEDEYAAMRALLAQAMDAGAFGLSSGLFYAPGMFATPDELSRLVEVLAGRPAVYASHIRNEGPGLIEAIDEFLEVGRRTGVRLELSHHKAAGRRQWGLTTTSLALLAQARAQGVAVAFDIYPYTASSTSIAALLPPWALEGGAASARERLRDRRLCERMRVDCESGLAGWESMIRENGYEPLVVASNREHRYEGMNLPQVAAAIGAHDPFDAVVHVLRDVDMESAMVSHTMSEPDVVSNLRDPHCLIGSDGLAADRGGRPHPRLTGTFPRVLARYVRDMGVLSLEEAVRRMTALPAQWFSLPARGRVAPGWIADLVAFDAGTVSDRGTYEDPMQVPTGIARVWQGGRLVVRDGVFLDERLGRRLRPDDAMHGTHGAAPPGTGAPS